MPTPHIFLASRTEQENQILRHKLEPLHKEFRNLHFLSVHHRGLIASLDQPAAVIVLNHVEWGARQQKDIFELRDIGYTGPILVVAKITGEESVEKLQSMDQVVFLEKPFEPRDFEGIIRKMLHARAVAQRIHRRYLTAQDVEIEPFGKNATYYSRVVNLSAGGAYLEFMSNAPVNEGELVRVRFDLSELNRTYTMPARIVWARKSANTSVAVGVEFIGPGDVKKNLLRL